MEIEITIDTMNLFANFWQASFYLGAICLIYNLIKLKEE